MGLIYLRKCTLGLAQADNHSPVTTTMNLQPEGLVLSWLEQTHLPLF